VSGLPDKLVTVGQVSGVFGVRGWVKVRSYTEPRENILGLKDWLLCWPQGSQPVRVEEGRLQGKGIVVKLKGIDDRDQAFGLIGIDIAVPRAALPPCAQGEYYWSDLEGMAVETTEAQGSQTLGRVTGLIATGAHDVLVVGGARERLIPFVLGKTVRSVDVDRALIVVDWDPSF
jgi:16S rRNA processing protein RimM